MAYLIYLLMRFIILVVIVDVVLTYFMSPYHPVRQALDRFVEPMLMPIRRVLPPVAGLDFSPLVLIIIVQLVGSLLINLF